MADNSLSHDVTYTIGPPSDDAEIDAMRLIKVALQSLDKNQRRRILVWVRDRYLETPEREINTLIQGGRHGS